MDNVKYPHIKVKLVGTDGNVFAIIGAVKQALKRAKVPANEIQEFQATCLNCESYDHVLQHVMKTVNVE